MTGPQGKESANATELNLGPLWDTIRGQLRERGIDVDLAACCEGAADPRVKVVCVASDLKESVAEVGKGPRDQVVMVRVDEETVRALDSWVETGAVRSRSEAAAVFMREGLKVRGQELEQLRDALREVDEARRKLRDKARVVFGGE